MEPRHQPTPPQLHRILSSLSADFNGFSGNCAAVAEILNDVLDGPGEYLLVDGEHYQFVDHVMLKWAGYYWDLNGRHTRQQVVDIWLSEDDDPDERLIEETLDSPAQLVDPNGCLAGGFDAGLFRDRLMAELAKPAPTAPARQTRVSP